MKIPLWRGPAAAVALVLTMLIAAAPARAATVAFDNFGAGNSFDSTQGVIFGTTASNGPAENALVFTAGASGFVTELLVPLAASQPTETATFTLFADGGAAPAAQIATANASVTNNLQSPQLYTITGWTGGPIASGTSYWLVASAPGATSAITWYQAPDGVTADRRFRFVDDGPAWTEGPVPEDAPAARLHVSAVPLPAAGWLLLGGLAALGGVATRRP